MHDGHSLVALFPGSRVPAATVNTHAVRAADGVVAIHLTRYPLTPPESAVLPESLDVHAMAICPRSWKELEEQIPDSWSREQRHQLRQQVLDQERLTRSAEVLVTRADGQPPLLALDAARRRFPWAAAVGVLIGDRSVMVGLRTHWHGHEEPQGYAVTMTATSDEAGPLSLYPSALYGWATWWIRQTSAVVDEPVGLHELPPLPLELDVVEAWQPCRVRLTGHERVRWPACPTPPARKRG
ncbi:hypothetical protein ABZ442_30530 [Streptomyces triculaminicus]|uniref:hypothetical protein n=1 Tax=Streptomyces triculaminicus TaxID=2816232 RepID=UPI0033E20A0C